MRLTIFVLSFFMVFATSVQAHIDQKEMKDSMDETKKLLNLEKTIERIEKGEINSRKLQIIYLILQNTSEH